jgi:hypothetical protein
MITGGDKVKRTIIVLSLMIILILFPTACSSKSVVSSTQPSININSSDADNLIIQHLYSLATTTHGKQVLAELREKMGIAKQFQNSDGSWTITYHMDEYEVKGNEILEPILIYEEPKDSSGQSVGYYMEWGVSADSLKIIPQNGNAIRIEAELNSPGT